VELCGYGKGLDVKQAPADTGSRPLLAEVSLNLLPAKVQRRQYSKSLSLPAIYELLPLDPGLSSDFDRTTINDNVEQCDIDETDINSLYARLISTNKNGNNDSDEIMLRELAYKDELHDYLQNIPGLPSLADFLSRINIVRNTTI
jgi:hypothetical protein